MSAIGNCPDLDALAALAREATAGEWKTPAEKPWRVYSGDVLIAVANGMTHPSDEVDADANAAYIAACAGRAEAGWKSTIAAIKMINMTKQDKEWRSRFDDLLMDELTQSILAAWPIELLTKEGV